MGDSRPGQHVPRPGTSPIIPSIPKRILVPGMRKASSSRISSLWRVLSRKSHAPRVQRSALGRAGRAPDSTGLRKAAIAGSSLAHGRGHSGQGMAVLFDATIDRVHGGYSSAAERLTVAQDVVGSIPTSRPNVYLYYLVRFTGFEVLWWANMGQARCNSCRVPRPLKTSPPRL